MTVSRLIARPMLASMFFVGGYNALRNASALGSKAAPVTAKVVPLAQRLVPAVPIPTDPVTLVRINAVAQLGAAAALATGHAPRTSALVLAASLVPTTVAGHRFWAESDKQQRSQQQLHFFKNVSMLGGLLLAAVDTEGKPGVAWRAQHAIGSAKREAKHLRKAAKREARLAAKSITS